MTERNGTVRAILTYHSIDSSGSVISVDPGTFRRQAEWLAHGSSRAVSVNELLDARDEEDCVAVVFDDAFENFGSVAWPILRDLGLPATVFVVSGRTGATNAWDGEEEPDIPTLPLLDWDALGVLAEDGVEIGSHTRSHPRLDGLDSSHLEEEIEGSAHDIESKLGLHDGAGRRQAEGYSPPPASSGRLLLSTSGSIGGVGYRGVPCPAGHAESRS